jgi:Holliday junction resolvase RusA-like endonuclease
MDSNLISFFVPGVAKTAGSKRAFLVRRKSDGKMVTVITDDNASSRDWKADVKQFAADAAAGHPLMDGPIFLRLTFYLTRPQGHRGKTGRILDSAPKYPTVKPDVDKLSRAILDALTQIIWNDDAQVVTKLAMKRYVDKPMQTAGVLIEIQEAE